MTPPITPIGDIGNAGLTEDVSETLTWETAADWDAAVAENSVVHETTYGGLADDVIQVGYPTGESGLVAMWPFQESGGSGTVSDVVGSHDGTVNGGTLGATGPANLTAYDTDNSDHTQHGSSSVLNNLSEITAIVWLRPDLSATNTSGAWSDYWGNDSAWTHRITDGGDITHWLGDAGNNNGGPTANANLSNESWVMVAYRWRTSDNAANVYADGSHFDLGTFNASSLGGPNDLYIGRRYTGSFNYGGGIALYQIFDTYLSDSVLEGKDFGTNAATLTTATKTVSSPGQPDLTGLSYNLNGLGTGTGQGIDLTVIGSPGGGSEEQVTQTLDGSSSYSLTWSNSHTDFRVQVDLYASSDNTTTPTLSAVSLQT